jgi:hypothetical protein
MTLRSFLLFIGTILISSAAQAYVPPYWMIMSRTAENHGRGIVVVDQDVIFSHAQEPLIVNERWIIQGENALRVEVTGRKQLKDLIRLTYVYQNGRRYFVDENGVRKSEKIPDNFFEPYFHFRFSKNMKPLLVSHNIAPAISLKSEPHRYSEKKPLPEPEPYVRLSRVGGTISYAIGTPSPADSSDAYPGIWIEQDRFVIRKLRLPSQLEISANNYKAYTQNLFLPQERTVTWQGQVFKILTSSASGAGGPKTTTALESTSLNFGENPKLSRLLPEDPIIKDFYIRLR